MSEKKIALVGSGWRAETWARLIGVLPGFRLTSVLVRNAQKAELFSARFGVKTVFSEEALLSDSPDLVLVCVPKGDNFSVTERFVRVGVKTLCETPAGRTKEEREIFSSWEGKVRVAEQYPLQPRFRALSALISSGALGRVNFLSFSCCHDYHAVALMRALLQTGDALPQVSCLSVADEYAETAGRNGDFPPELLPHERRLALLRFGDRTAAYDFSQAQYFSQIRRARILVQGTLGECENQNGVRLSDGRETPFTLSARYEGRDGSLFSPDLRYISCEGNVLYENPFFGLRLSEEEIAMAECLVRAAENFSARDCCSPCEAAIDAEIADRMRDSRP